MALAQECPELPASLYALLKAQDANSIATYHSALKHCPGKIASLGNSSVERSYFKKVLSLHQRHLENVLLAQKSDRYLEDDLSRYLEISRALGIYEKAPQALLDKVAEARRTSRDREKACTTIDNRTPALDLPRDQDEIGWCYAYAAADLISHKLKVPVSALDIVFKYNITDIGSRGAKLMNELQLGQTIKIPNMETRIESGNIEDSINTMMETGVCSEKDLPSRNHVLSNLKRDLEEIHRLKDRMQNEQSICDFSAYRKSFARFPNLSLPQILQTTIETSHLKLMHELAERNCKKRMPISHLSTKTFSATKDFEGTMSALNKQLEKGSIAAISYDSQLLQNGSRGGHASTITGRFFNKDTGECNYYLRNTWGAWTDSKSGLKNVDGYYVVPASSLREDLKFVTYLD